MCVRAELPGGLHVIWVSGCHRRCCLGVGLYVPTPATLVVGRGKILLVSLQNRPSPRVHLHRSESRMSRYPTSAVNAPSLTHICGDVPLSYLDGFAQRMLLSEKNIKNASSRFSQHLLRSHPGSQ